MLPQTAETSWIHPGGILYPECETLPLGRCPERQKVIAMPRQIRPLPPGTPGRPRSWKELRRRRRRRLWLRRLLLLGGFAGAAALLAIALPTLGQPVLAAAVSGQGMVQQQSTPRPQPAEVHVVAVDPGHGGDDVGAEGLGFYEDEMTWQTAQELMTLLQADDRFDPRLTREEEETVTPTERAAQVREMNAELLLSIHGNSDPIYGSAGYECYPVPPGRARNADSVRFGELLAQGFEGAGASLRGENGVRYLYYDDNGDKWITEASDPEVHWEFSFTLLEQCGCPAVLSEQCFVTNSADVAAFGSDTGCRTSARIYYEAICDWFGLTPA